MKTITIKHEHPFIDELRERFRTELKAGMTVVGLQKLVRQCYNYDMKVDYWGRFAVIAMTDDEYTMWVLRFSK